MSFTTEDTFPHFARRRDLDINVAALGAEGKNPTRDTAIIQDAIKVAENTGRALILPKIYRTNAPLVISAPIHILSLGNWPNAGIVNAVSDVLVCSPGFAGAINDVAFTGVHLKSEVGGGHVFAPGLDPTGVLGRWRFDRCRLTQDNAAKSLWHQVDAGGLVASAWRDCLLYHRDPAVAVPTVPGFNLKGAGQLINSNLWDHCVPTYSGEYFFHIENTSAGYAYDNVFRDCVGEVLVGGFAKILSGKGTIFDNVQNWDMQVFGASIRDWIYIGKSAAGLASVNTDFRKPVRNGGALGGGLVDIRLEAANGAQRNRIALPHHDSLAGYAIDCGNNVVIWEGGLPLGLTLTNQLTPSVASAAVITLPTGAWRNPGQTNLSGNATVDTINGTYAGHVVTLHFSSAAPAQVSQAGNIVLAGAGNFNPGTQHSTLTLATKDGVSWFEIGRMVN